MKRKPYRSVGSNILWSFRGQLKYSPRAFFMSMLRIPLNIALSYAVIYLPSLVVAEVTGEQSFEHAAVSVGLVMLQILVCNLLIKVVMPIISAHEMSYRDSIERAVHKKSLSCLYQLYEKKKMRDLYDRAQNACWCWNGAWPVMDLPKKTYELIESVLCYILFGTFIVFVDPWILVVLTAAPVINWFCVRAFQNWEYRNREIWADIERKLWYVLEKPSDFAAAKDIRIYGMSRWLIDMYRDLSDKRGAWDRKTAVRDFVARIADLVMILVRDGLAYGILIAMILRGEISVDQFVFYFAAISSFATWIGSIVSSWNVVNSTSLAVCDLREYLDFPDMDGSGEADISDYLNVPLEITFDKVCFRYDGADADTLHDVSFTMHPGENIALVGLNGAGKTTIVKLLCGLYLPTSGEIRINGTPVSKFYRSDYYKLFAPVFQKIKTAFFSLAETVSGQSEEKADLKRVEQCLRQAGLGEKLDTLPEGIHTKLDKQVHENGIELSGGEAQKLMLARALYKDAPVLVLDEPTAALDPIAEHEIYRQYQSMSEGKNSLFISHRLASTRFCDRILYLQDGQITECGTHEELLAAGGEYSRLYELQSCWYRR